MSALNKFPDNFIVDPSLLMTPDFDNTAENIRDQYGEMYYHFPKTFVNELDQIQGLSPGSSSELPSSLRFFNAYTDIPELDSLRETVRKLDVGQFDATQYFETYEPVYHSLADTLPYASNRRDQEGKYTSSGDPLTDIVFEEYVFLQERSGWKSRLKRTITNLVEAGVTIIEANEESVNKYLDKYTKNSAQRRKALAKKGANWVAVSVILSADSMGGFPAAVSLVAVDAAFLLVFDP